MSDRFRREGGRFVPDHARRVTIPSDPFRWFGAALAAALLLGIILGGLSVEWALVPG